MLIDLIMGFFFSTPTSSTKLDLSSYSLVALLVILFIALVAFGALCVAFVCFIKFILNVNRNEVFTKKNVSLIRKYGVCALLCGVSTIVLNLLGGIDIVKAMNDGFDALGEGLFALLMAEVFGIGLKLQEGKE
jgi:hypothetical protein